MGGKASRVKGHDFERKIAAQLRDIFPNAQRGLQSNPAATAPDIDGTPYFIECKKHAKCNIKAAYEQAREGSMKEHYKTKSAARDPIAITQDDRAHILVTMNMLTFKNLLERAFDTFVEPGPDPAYLSMLVDALHKEKADA